MSIRLFDTLEMLLKVDISLLLVNTDIPGDYSKFTVVSVSTNVC